MKSIAWLVWMAVFLMAVGFGMFLAVEWSVALNHSRIEKSANAAYRHGYEARKLDVPAQANPAVDVLSRRLWLDGWMCAEKEIRDKK